MPFYSLLLAGLTMIIFMNMIVVFWKVNFESLKLEFVFIDKTHTNLVSQSKSLTDVQKEIIK
jgi:hypothetical protein